MRDDNEGPNLFVIPSKTEAEGQLPGIELEILWHDNEVTKLRVVADNGHFRAAADMYSDRGVFQESLKPLMRFPLPKAITGSWQSAPSIATSPVEVLNSTSGQQTL